MSIKVPLTIPVIRYVLSLSKKTKQNKWNTDANAMQKPKFNFFSLTVHPWICNTPVTLTIGWKLINKHERGRSCDVDNSNDVCKSLCWENTDWLIDWPCKLKQINICVQWKEKTNYLNFFFLNIIYRKRCY